MLTATAVVPAGLAGNATASVQPRRIGPTVVPVPVRVSMARCAEIGVNPEDGVVMLHVVTGGSSRPAHAVRTWNQLE